MFPNARDNSTRPHWPYTLSLGLYAVAGLILYAGIDLDSSLPVVVDYRSGVIFEAGTLLPVKPYKVTGYCPCPHCCGRWSDGITASGTKATQGRTIAGDPTHFDMGTCLSLPGLGQRTVEDTGSAIKGRRIDVYFDSHEDALRWGVRWLPVKEC
jgi:3D (Asp-Asp-Asp) domain-containing protein